MGNRTKKYIQLPGQNKAITSIKGVATEGLKLVSKSIEYLSPVKNNICLILSGGIDSSITTTLSNRILNIDKTYSTVYPFENPKLNIEKDYAISASNALETKHFIYEGTNKEYLTAFIETVFSVEEPLHHLQSVCQSLLYWTSPKNFKDRIDSSADFLF